MDTELDRIQILVELNCIVPMWNMIEQEPYKNLGYVTDDVFGWKWNIDALDKLSTKELLRIHKECKEAWGKV